MFKGPRVALTALGIGALAMSVATDAMASRPVHISDLMRSHARTTVNGNLTVTNVLHVNKNTSVYGKLYAHGGMQVYKGMLVRNGGITVAQGGVKSDSLVVTGPLQAMSANVNGNVQAAELVSSGSITGSSLQLTGGATVGGKLTASGGLDTGTGAITAGSLTTTGDVTTRGNLSATGATFTNLAVAGAVNFGGATVTGLNLSNVNLANATLSALNLGSPSSTAAPLNISQNGQTAQLGVDSSGALAVRSLSAGTANVGSLSLGSTTSTTSALSLSANGHTNQISVDANGNLSVGGLAVQGGINATGNLVLGGGLTINSTAGIIASNIQAPNAANTTTPGALSLQGNTITLSGNTTSVGNLTVGNGSDLVLSAPSSTSNPGSHIIANGASDVAGSLIASVGPSTAPGTDIQVNVSFRKAYTSNPIVVVTSVGDPSPGTLTAPKVFVSINGSNGAYTGFTLHYIPAATTSSSGSTVTYDYHVIGS